MFKPSQLHHSSCHNKCEKSVPQNFGLLCWNVHKNNTKDSNFKTYLEAISSEYIFMLLQEASFRDDKPFVLPDFSFDAAANLEFRDTFYGVLTSSTVKSNRAEAFLSEGKESMFGPHKSLLLSHYSFDDGSVLLILNVHAINFRENQSYDRELERFLTLMQNHKGAMIVAGDFNTWNKKRMQKLHEIRKKLGLKMVPFTQNDSIKSFMGKHLDFIFYRGIELVKYSTDKGHKLSDHNPLFAKFKKVL